MPRFKSMLNGYDVSIDHWKNNDSNTYAIMLSIHESECVDVSHILELSLDEMVDLINSLQTLVNNAEENNNGRS